MISKLQLSHEKTGKYSLIDQKINNTTLELITVQFSTCWFLGRDDLKDFKAGVFTTQYVETVNQKNYEGFIGTTFGMCTFTT